MSALVRRSSTVAAAVALAALTLAVFGLQQARGPTSSVQRLHEAVRAQDPVAYQRVLVEPIGDSYAFALYHNVRRLIMQGRTIQVQRTRMRGRVAQVEVVYAAGTLPSVTIVFVVGLTRAGWKVSAVETARVFETLRTEAHAPPDFPRRIQ